MTETIIIVLIFIVIVLAAGLIRQFLREKPEVLQTFLNDTGYENNGPPIEAHAKILRLTWEPGLNYGHRNRYVDYHGIIFELESGEQIELEVSDYDFNTKYWEGMTGTLYYHPDRFFDFKIDDTPENRIKMFM